MHACLLKKGSFTTSWRVGKLTVIVNVDNIKINKRGENSEEDFTEYNDNSICSR